ncbi:MAG: hypothetical protein QOI06_1537 [Nocardioidaceae bacterium]|jgi:S1-C subfamily serine protease|nr:hypothetical protein [Nocardioidaceae bacterium]
MNDFGDSEQAEPTRPIEGIEGRWQPAPAAPTPAAPTPAAPAPGAPIPVAPTPVEWASATTWQWNGGAGPAPMGSWPGAQQRVGAPPPRPPVSRKVKVLGTAAALLLVGGAAAGGAAYGFTHSSYSSSAAGIAGGIGSAPSQMPSQGHAPLQGQVPGGPSTGGNGHQRGNGNASRFSTPGHASAAQSVGVVDIKTKLKYESAKAAGTGMILTSNGEVLTNNHVVEGATKIKVEVVSTGQKYAATVVGTDKVGDVAVLQLTGASGLSSVSTDTAPASVGDPVTAVGNAMGVGGVPSAAKGTITGLNRSITTQSEGGVVGERLTGLIEVNAQVIAGDSGGPLYNSDGKVVGMDTAASSSPAQSTGFAIPISRALMLATEIENGDTASGNITLGTPAFLGVQFQPGITSGQGHGAVISGVLGHTPAASAGLIAGDTITSVDGTAITSGDQLRTVLSNFKPGASVALGWTDTQGGSHTTSVTLISGPAE